MEKEGHTGFSRSCKDEVPRNFPPQNGCFKKPLLYLMCSVFLALGQKKCYLKSTFPVKLLPDTCALALVLLWALWHFIMLETTE